MNTVSLPVLPPAGPTEQHDVRIAGGLVYLMLREEEWVYRRQERFSFVDDETGRRQMTVDFELPMGANRLISELYRAVPPAFRSRC